METKKRLGELLLEAGVIDQTQLQSALGHQRRWGVKLGQALLDLKLATEPQVVAALARKFGYEVAHLGAVQPGPALEAAMKLVPGEVATRHTLLPIAADTNSITVAMADPTNIAVVDELSFRTGRRVKVSIAGERELAVAIRKLYFGDQSTGPEPIALEESDGPFETTTNPFGALPDHMQAGYVDPPAAPPPPAYRAVTTPPPVLRPAAQAEPPARPVPAPPLAAPPLQAFAPVRPPPAPSAAVPAALEEDVVDLSDLGATPATPPLSPREAALTDAIERLARGNTAPGSAAVKVAASMVRLLIRKGFFTEVEFLDELQGHNG